MYNLFIRIYIYNIYYSYIYIYLRSRFSWRSLSVDLRTELPPAKPAGPLRLGTKTVWGGTSTGTAGIMFFAPWDKQSHFPWRFTGNFGDAHWSNSHVDDGPRRLNDDEVLAGFDSILFISSRGQWIFDTLEWLIRFVNYPMDCDRLGISGGWRRHNLYNNVLVFFQLVVIPGKSL